MANDFQKKQPTKNEKMFYDMAMSLEMIDRRLWTTSSFVSALAILANVEPEKVARLLTTDMNKIQDFSKKINDEINKIEAEEKEKNGSSEQVQSSTQPGHEGHNHA
ncbi:MAG: hypothetical protein JWO40_539 [Candidatus Doudnabacteria bacterium]|nr:hypothetical protein [Candidatus Doudnabacteria bacterium]